MNLLSDYRLLGVCLCCSMLTGVVCAQSAAPYQPITGAGRVKWVVTATAGFPSLAAVAVTSGFDTWIDTPKEYDTHWKGFGQRYGLRMAGLATSNAMEAGIGAVVGEDPRYVRAPDNTPFTQRVGRTIKWTFVAPHADGNLHPAYARYLALAGSAGLQTVWVPESQATAPQFLERTGLGLLSHAAGNAWEEFWPDVKRKLLHK